MATPSSDDDAPLLGQTESVNAEPWGKNVHSRYYTLPFCRFTNIVKIILIIDVISSLAFWITGGNTKYFVDNILHFHFLQSTFDLALLASVRVVLLFLFYDLLEHYTFLQIDAPYEPKLSRKKSGCHAAVILVPLLCLGFAATKGGLILNSVLNDKNYDHMHLTYNILVISTVVFIFLELCLGLGSFIAMRRFKKQRVLHRLNIMGQEIDDDGKPMKKNVDIIRLAKLAGPEACLIASGTFCLLVSTASDTAAPYYFGMVVDAALHSMDKLNHTILILFGIYAAGALSSSLRAFLFTLAGQRLVARLRKNIFNCIIAQEVAFFDVTRTGELTNRLSSDTQVLQNAVTVNVSMLSRYVLQIIGSLVLMFGLNASLTGVMLAVVPVIALGAVQYGAYMKKIQQQFQDCLADASTTAEETISSMRTVRSFCGEKKAGKAYGKDIDRSYSAGKKLAIGSGLFYGVVSFLINGAIALVLWYGGKLVHDKALTPGVLTSFLLYTIQVAMAFGLITSLYGDFMRAVGASLRIFDLLDRKPEVPNEGGAMMSSMKGGVEFQHVYFTYPSRPDNKVLRDVSFKVEPGQVVALVGPSGGGKSTIVNLIERFYDPEEGKISLNGCELQGLDPQWFRKQIAMVSQEPVLFACSIKDNIMYGRDATMEQVIDAAKQANAHNFITTFEEGYETLVGERGVRLSGGQKQRVAIARALIMNPSVLLLDEATSALDAESEHLVQEAIDRAMRNRTVLVIAHRLSTVRNADQVVVIDKGSVAEKGTHEELLESDGVYKRLVLRQLTAGGAGKTEDDEQAPSSVVLPRGGDDKLLVA